MAAVVLDSAGLASLGVAAALCGSIAYRLSHLNGAASSTAMQPIGPIAALLVMGLFLLVCAHARRESARRNVVLARERAAADYSRMMLRTAAIEREMYGEVLSPSVQDWLDIDRPEASPDR